MGMSSTSQEEMAKLLSTVTATHHIREFRFWFATIKAPVLEVCTWVDTAMSTVDIPIVKVRVYEEGWVKFFPQLREKNMVWNSFTSIPLSTLTRRVASDRTSRPRMVVGRKFCQPLVYVQ
jgi:hypothetical protein